ncbi:hypothetical protein F4776DRAFT_325120 [Hypoxylon sp. NC0597]|nr:hypothetical protein F4776DRAFT_325120 [Hypoxylon sp. NC0597]
MNQAPPAQLAQGQQQVRLLRPEQMRTINYLTAEEKLKYEEGLRQLYHKMEQNSPESQEYQQARHKVAEFSRMVINKIKSIQARTHAASQGQSSQAGQAGQPGHQGHAGHPDPHQQPAQNEQAQNSMAAAATAQKVANRPQGPAPNTGAMNPSSSNPNVAPAGAQAPTAMPKQIVEHMSRLPWGLLRPPAQLPPEQANKWLNEMRQRYARFLMQMENIKARGPKLDAMIKDQQEKGPFSPDNLKKFHDQKAADSKAYEEAQRFVENVRQQLKAAQAARVGSQGSSAQGARPQSMQSQNVNVPASSHPMQAATASVNAAMDAAKSQQLAGSRPPVSTSQPQPPPQSQPQQPQQPQQQQQQQQQPHPGTPATPATVGAQQHPQQPQVQSHPVPTPQPQIKNESTNNIPHPPPVNTALAAAAASSAHVPSAGTPTQASARVQTPQSAGQQAASQVRPLTHAAAVNRANSSTNINSQPNSSSGGIASTPGSSGLVSNANHTGHPHAHPQSNTPALNPKMPINKTLPPKATETPQPVSTGGGNGVGRPSMGGGGAVGGGVMGQPVIQKMPVPQFDADGEHVLSKKKLDELVRMVCGGGSPGADGNYLTPDVEESVLSVADNFVDSVLHSACRLAKERGSKVLEIRDIQLVLERVYNIRIPGYTSDELRTVRKIQPSANWISKVHAVQAAKVMPGKDDK